MDVDKIVLKAGSCCKSDYLRIFYNLVRVIELKYTFKSNFFSNVLRKAQTQKIKYRYKIKTEFVLLYF